MESKGRGRKMDRLHREEVRNGTELGVGCLGGGGAGSDREERRKRVESGQWD
jgi:hypothetical protein